MLLGGPMTGNGCGPMVVANRWWKGQMEPCGGIGAQDGPPQAMLQPVGLEVSPRVASRAKLRTPALVKTSVVIRSRPRQRAFRPPHGRRVK